MMLIRRTVLLGVLAAAVAGCSAIDRLTGATDNTVLPGAREDAIPGRTEFPDTPDPLVNDASQQQGQASDTATGCQPDDPACAPPTGDDTFSDPQ